ncbi:MAG: DUF1761 domain-containing protein [Bacteroidota bacterium]
MSLDLSSLNWLAIGVCLVFAQIFLSIWFIVLFGTPWAKEYGAKDRKQHTKEIPGYTYGIQAFCTLLLIVGLASLQSILNVKTLAGGVLFGLFVALFYSIATALPGYLFQKRMKAFLMAMGSQAVLIVVVSIMLALWK